MTNATLSSWSQWDEIHGLSDQVKRQKSASEKKNTPVSIDRSNATGTFKGSAKSNYVTTLSSCNCVDFSRRHLPCKHMYRLAHELSLFSLGAVSSGHVVTRDEAISKITQILSEDEIATFAYFCYHCGNNQASSELFPSDFANRLIKNRLAEEVSDIPTLLTHLHMNDIRKFLPAGVKSPSKKVDLISLVAPNVAREEIIFPDNMKCLTLHSDIAHLGHSIHRRLCALYPKPEQELWFDL